MSTTEICGCCDGIEPETPAPIDNRPGLTAISCRSGTWDAFRATMLDALSATPGLAALQTRSEDDFTIALLDAWAIVCDILTFYQERLANEAYLRTATERVSVAELAKLIGYKLRPGVAASAALAFTLDQPAALPPVPAALPPGAPREVVLDVGTKVQSIPDPGQQPAVFETTGTIPARAAWNAIAPRLHAPPGASNTAAAANVRLQGLVGSLHTGDRILVVGRDAPDAPVLHRVKGVVLDTGTQTTTVRFEADQAPAPAPLPSAAPSPLPGPLDDVFLRANVKGHAWADQGALVAFAQSQQWSVDALEDGINALRDSAAAPPPLQVFVMGAQAAVFGHNAPDWNTLPASLRIDSGVQKVDANGTPTGSYQRVPAPFGTSWEGFLLFNDPVNGWTSTIDLDNAYPAAVKGRRVVLQDPQLGAGSFRATGITDVQQVTRSGYLLTGKASRITVAAAWWEIWSFHIRTTTVLVETEQLAIADVVLDDEVGGRALLLDGAYLSLKVGQLVAVTGLRADKAGETASEVVSVAALALVDGYTEVTFDPPLTNTYVRASVTVNANVAAATHGESRSEILGSGDASATFQRFKLAQPPVTYVSAATPSGTASTLEVRVNGVRWDEVSWLYGAGPGDRVYTVVADADGRTYVQFGDGTTGARPPSGTNNITAHYRQGIGRAGLVRAGQLSMLLSRPLGLKEARNPLASAGAGDPETLDQARSNAPVTVRTMDRIVSLEDFADFARASAGIAKASVTWVWDGTRTLACVTVAGAGGAPVVNGSPQFVNLLQAMRAAGDGTVPVVLCNAVPVAFAVAATVTVDPTLVPAAVLDAVKAALRLAFGFDARGSGDPVYRSEVIECIQDVPGVVAMTLDRFGYAGSAAGPAPDVLVATGPTVSGGSVVGAQLLTLDTGPLSGVVAP